MTRQRARAPRLIRERPLQFSRDGSSLAGNANGLRLRLFVRLGEDSIESEAGGMRRHLFSVRTPSDELGVSR